MRLRTRWLIISAVLALVVYAAMWIAYAVQWNPLLAFDDAGLAGPHRYGSAHPAWVMAWGVFCTVLGPFALRAVALVMVVVALVRRQGRIALFLVLSVELTAVTTEVAKNLVDRPRPATALVYAGSTSFPSGHALGVMAGVLAFLALAWPRLGPPWRWFWGVLGVVVIVAIGIGRVVLNVHHPSDVIAGWALGYAWFAVVFLLVPPYPVLTRADGTPVAPGSAR